MGYDVKFRTFAYSLGGSIPLTAEYEVETFKGEFMDTKVTLKSEDGSLLLCVISGTEMQNFQRELEQLINRYRI
mgnify:FL=1|jgi:hypothetical protein